MTAEPMSWVAVLQIITFRSIQEKMQGWRILGPSLGTADSAGLSWSFRCSQWPWNLFEKNKIKIKTPYAPSWNTFHTLPKSSVDLEVSVPSLFVARDTKKRWINVPVSACPSLSSPPCLLLSLSVKTCLSLSQIHQKFPFCVFLSHYLFLSLSLCLLLLHS